MNLHSLACKLGHHVWQLTLKDWTGEERQCIVCERFEHALDPEHHVTADGKWHWMAGRAWRPAEQFAKSPNALTPEENEAMRAVTEGWNAFLKLPPQHPEDRREMMLAIHAAQNIILARPTVREMGWVKDEQGRIVSSTNKPSSVV